MRVRRRSPRLLSFLVAAVSTGVVAAVTAPVAVAGTVQSVVVDAVPSTKTPDVNDGTVYALAKVGDIIVAGGTFTSVTGPGGAAVARTNLFAFDGRTGAIVPSFAPTVNGEVRALLAGPNNTVYVAGAFNTVNGVTQRLVRLDVATGAISSGWRSQLNAATSAVTLTNGVLYVGGSFTLAGGVAHNGLAALDPVSGKVLPWFTVGVSGRHGQGTAKGALGPKDLEVDPSGRRMVVIGNFTSATDASGTVDRDQAMLIDLGPSTAAINRSWRTLQFTGQCANNAFDSWVRDVDIDPSGTYFVVASSGASGTNTDGSRALCDSAARFELAGTGTNVQPTWVSWTGRDSLWSVAISGTAVYVGGHQRWLNNLNGNDSAGAGALPRPGLAAIDPVSGVPLSWNPGRNPRGAGAFALLLTDTGLYVGSDTAWIGNFTYQRKRVAFFPLVTGAALPSDATGSLPGRLVMAGGLPVAASGAVLYRVNAAGPGLSSLDGGPSWASDNSWFSNGYHNAGSTIATYSSSIPVDATVPASTPVALFNSERYDSGSRGDNQEMKWAFPVASGTTIAVRLYFAERFVSSVGQRRFDVSIDGTKVLDAFDIVAATGANRGTMREFSLTSDGSVNIDFAHLAENPLVNGIEILKVVPGSGPVDPTIMRAAHLDASGTVGATTTLDGTTMDWGTTRGAFLTSGYLYYGKTDSTFNRRTYDGTVFGAEERVDPYNDPFWSSVDTGSGQTYRGVVPTLYGQLGSVTSMFTWNHRLYYTLTGQSAMYSRGFAPSAGTVGDVQTTVPDGFDWSQVAGAVVAGDSLYFALKTGPLRKVAWVNGMASGPVTTVDSTQNWAARSLFVLADPPNVAPVAALALSCPPATLQCVFDASASRDPDGTVTRYDWDFGDGATAADAGATPSHTYAAAGTYSVTVTVTDAVGATATAVGTARPTATLPATIGFRAGAQTGTASTASVSVTVPAQVEAGDTMVLFETINNTTVVPTDPVGWTLVGTLKNQSASSVRALVRTATADDAGSSVTMTYSGAAKASAVLLAYSGVSTAAPLAELATAIDSAAAAHVTPTAPVVSPAGWAISYWADKSATAASSWTAPADVAVRSTLVGGGSGAVTQLVADSGGPVDVGSYGGKTASVDVTSNKGMTMTLILQAG